MSDPFPFLDLVVFLFLCCVSGFLWGVYRVFEISQVIASRRVYQDQAAFVMLSEAARYAARVRVSEVSA